MRRIERGTAFKRDYRRIKATSRYRDLDERLAGGAVRRVMQHALHHVVQAFLALLRVERGRQVRWVRHAARHAKWRCPKLSHVPVK